MTTFCQAVVKEHNKTQTENGMASFKSSLNANVDLFFAIGASRGKDITQLFDRALHEDTEMAVRCLLWARDARGGAGEREQFRKLAQYLEQAGRQDILDRILPIVPELGRWDDLLVFKTEAVKAKAFSLIGSALKQGHGLCAKWMPRKGAEAASLREFLGLTPKGYRKTLVGLSNTVEQAMCAKNWDAIEFGKLPSLASARYQKAFLRNAAERYSQYKAALVKGEAKINAGAVYPYDVIKSVKHGDEAVANEQWKALPDYLNGDHKILPMVDLSGSMMSPVGGNANLQCYDVAVSLGLYIATKQTGAFGHALLSFTDTPTLQMLKPASLKNMYQQVVGGRVGYSTNVQGAYEEILRVAVKNKVPQSEMPEYLLLLSDMQFDAATGDYNGSQRMTAYKLARQEFKAAGYELPKIIFWNLNDRGGNIPVKYDQNGTALVSGFSPSLMASILGAKTVTPEGIMREALMKPRYNVFG